MINLIPREAERMVRREYLLRVGAVWALIVAVVVVAGACMLIPGYVLTKIAASVPSEALQISSDARAVLVAELARSQAIAEKLNATPKDARASEILAHVEAPLEDSIALQGFALVLNADTSTAKVQGTATTREALQTFVENLKKDPFFKDASVPVSDLARDRNLTFTLTLTLAPLAP